MKLPGLLAGLLCSVAVFAGQVYVASVSHQSGSYSIEVDTLVQLSEPRVRALLTDYDNLWRVNPAIEVSEILLTRGWVTTGCVRLPMPVSGSTVCASIRCRMLSSHMMVR